jgi:hypothetical protein
VETTTTKQKVVFTKVYCQELSGKPGSSPIPLIYARWVSVPRQRKSTRISRGSVPLLEPTMLQPENKIKKLPMRLEAVFSLELHPAPVVWMPACKVAT